MRAFHSAGSATVVLLLGSGCGGRAPGSLPAPDGAAAVYEFQEWVSGATPAFLRGTMTVSADTILFEGSPGPCHHEIRGSSATDIAFRCGSVTYRIDRSDPVNRVTYTTRVWVTVRERVCVRYETDSSGRRFCAQSRTEAVEREASRSGRLRMRPHGSGGAI